MMVTRTGPFATAATGVSSAQQDYFTLVNMKGGIDGHKIVWEECEFEYKVPRALECYERHRGKWKIVYPNAAVIFALADRVTKDEVLAINLAGGRSDSDGRSDLPVSRTRGGEFLGPGDLDDPLHRSTRGRRGEVEGQEDRLHPPRQ